MTGRAHIILDNLIAEKKARPMVVVMPVARGGGSLGLGPSGMSPGIQAAGNVVARRPRGGPAGPGGAPARLRGRRCCRPFAQDFIGDLMPLVEKTFRVSTRPEDRAIGGLSAGGAATVNTAFSRPELFRYVVIMSAGAGQTVEAAVPEVLCQRRRGGEAVEAALARGGRRRLRVERHRRRSTRC